MSQTPNTTRVAAPATSTSPVDDDPLSHLHKMSTTAGLGSGEYVAVNGAAVFSLLLGLASALTLFWGGFALLAVTCIVVSIVAWGQISGSNGTQTGKGLIVAGMILALAFGGFVGARELTEKWRTREDRAAIRKTVEEFGAKIKAGDVEGAYAMLSPRMQQAVPMDRFKQTATFVRQSDLYGALKETTWNELVAFQNDDATKQRYAVTKMKMTLEKGNIDQDVTLQKDGENWRFVGMESFFPPQQQPRGGG